MANIEHNATGTQDALLKPTDDRSSTPGGSQYSSPSRDATVSGVAVEAGSEDGSSINGAVNGSDYGSSGPPSVHGGGTTGTAHPKKFTTVNAAKKFLQTQKPAPHAASSQVASNTAAAKSNLGSVAKPTPTVPTQSRLVTAKLTTAPLSSAAGWSRPGSAAGPASASPAPNGNPASPTAQSGTHAGKGMASKFRGESPSRASPPNSGSTPPGPSRSAWNIQPANPQDTATRTRTRDDFPTAAEVAQARALRSENSSTHAEQPATHETQELQEQANAFRGVNLNPNASHWDEMVEEDDNFLDDDIDFGDGRQYKVEAADVPIPHTPVGPPNGAVRTDPSKPDVAVSKEERFVDDFDRSWPGSQPTQPAVAREPLSRSALSPVQESGSSRVLFNERSNRLEPYGSVQPSHRPGAIAPPTMPRHGSRPDPLSPTERQGRDDPPHSNVQLLQKMPPPHLADRRGPPSKPHGLFPEREFSRRDSASTLSPLSPRELPLRRFSGPLHDPREQPAAREPADEVPPPKSSSLQNGGRQLPPHLTMPSRAPAPVRSPLSASPGDTSRREFLTAPIPTPSADPASPKPPAVQPPPALSADEYNVASKAVMQSAVERARQRRQQEEEEREREKERARRKAAELEEKEKAKQAAAVAAEAPKPEPSLDEQVADTLQAAAKLAQSQQSDVTAPPPRLARPPSLRGDSRVIQPPPRPAVPRRLSSATAEAASPSMLVDSWRSTAHPRPPPVSRPVQGGSPVSQPSLPPPPLMHEMESLSRNDGEELEVVDFAELGKLVGQDEEPPVECAPPSRPVASDFFEEDTSPTSIAPTASASADTNVWRRGAPRPTALNSATMQPSSATAWSRPPAETDVSPVTPGLPAAPPRPPLPTATTPGFASSQRSPHHSTFRESSMSALDDVMSRIKGAIDGMQHESASQESPAAAETEVTPPRPLLAPSVPVKPLPLKELKWVPPALRLNPPSFKKGPAMDEPWETFDVTAMAPPPSPKPAWNTFSIRLPKDSQEREPVPKRQMNVLKNVNTFVRWEIMSFDPPVYGMMKGDLSVNAVLFKPPLYKGVIKPRVRIPRFYPRPPYGDRRANSSTMQVGGVDPGRKVAGAFGKPKGADDFTSWRRPQASATEDADDTTGASATDLEPLSRSPPPELAAAAVVAIGKEQASSGSSDATHARRNSLKMPAGSSVAFYRDSRVDTADDANASSVNFTVVSELEDGTAHSTTAVSVNHKSDIEAPVSRLPSARIPVVPLPVRADGAASDVSSTTPDSTPRSGNSRSSDGSVPITPLTQTNSTWTKSPLSFPVKEMLPRAPEDDHLKAVWSQASDKAGLPAVNSLEKIGDDLTALPFTLSDVKSERGTPPPSSSGAPPPSRMSLSDVTRAFQQVPESSNPPPAQSNGAAQSPLRTSTTLPTFRPQSSYSYGPPLNMRPVYPPYGSPMLSSPSPTMMYPPPGAPSPAPRPVPGHPPPYGQPMWMPMPPPGPGTPNGMRPMHSPYPQQVMSYPSPTGSPMYAPAPQMAPPGAGRGRGNVPMMGPPMHAMPMYVGSPVMMQAPPMAMSPSHSYPGPSPVLAGRAPARNPYEHPQTVSPGAHAPPHHPYAPAPFARPW